MNKRIDEISRRIEKRFNQSYKGLIERIIQLHKTESPNFETFTIEVPHPEWYWTFWIHVVKGKISYNRNDYLKIVAESGDQHIRPYLREYAKALAVRVECNKLLKDIGSDFDVLQEFGQLPWQAKLPGLWEGKTTEWMFISEESDGEYRIIFPVKFDKYSVWIKDGEATVSRNHIKIPGFIAQLRSVRNVLHKAVKNVVNSLAN